MKPDDFTKTLEMAILHGGHFHRKLAEAGLAADPINKAKIFRTFPDLVLNYWTFSLYSSQAVSDIVEIASAISTASFLC